MRAQVRPFRYMLGIILLCIVGFSGGDVLWSAIYMGIAYGFIDYMDRKRGK